MGNLFVLSGSRLAAVRSLPADTFDSLFEKAIQETDLHLALALFREASRYAHGENIAKCSINIGGIYLKWGSSRHALNYFREAECLTPGSPSVHYNIGCVYDALKEYPQAITAYNRALELNPLYPEAHYNIALIYCQVPEHMSRVEALRHFRMFLKYAAPLDEFREYAHKEIQKIHDASGWRIVKR